jgi:hypothetical protein
MKSFLTSLKNFIRHIGVLIGAPRPRQFSPHCTNINMLLMHLCDFNQLHYSYILQWLAYPLRNPGAKMCYGLVIKGGQGTGKNMFFQNVAVPLYEGKARIVHADVLSDRFNCWAGAPLVVIDSTLTARALARVKALMTSKSLIIESRSQPPREMANRMNFIFLSGDFNPPRLERDNRRFMILETPPAREHAFYQAVAHEIKNGGVDAFREFLLHGIDMAGFNETTQPPGFERGDANEYRAGSAHAAQEAA